ncbi:MAG: diflavin flavoprotein [Cyanobacteria bacterium J06634_5]
MTEASSFPQSIPTTLRPRDVQIAEIGAHTTTLRSRTWERLKFEVEYNRRRGTTANSYLISAERTALIDPPGESFTPLYLQTLQPYLAERSIDYIILGHVNPNRMVTLAALMQQLPEATIVCSRPAAQALRTAFPNWDAARIHEICPPHASLDLGQGHYLQLLTMPTPRWPDGLCTYDMATRILFSDKLFGTHVCEEALFDENWRELERDRRYYFECLHASQTKQVQAALEELAKLSVRCIAPGHGSLVLYSLSRLQDDYIEWCQQQSSQSLQVALLYASAYGNTAAVAHAITQGLLQAGIAVKSVNCETSDPAELAKTIEASEGFIMGSPTLAGQLPVQMQTALGVVVSSAAKTKLAGVFGSYGWSGEAIDLIEQKLRDHNYRLGFETLRVRFVPNVETIKACQRAGTEFARQLKKLKKQQLPRQAITEVQAGRTEQAVGRIVGSLGVLTTTYDEGSRHSGVLVTWMSQASFSPAGLMMSVPADYAKQHLAQSRTPFVLNLLKEGRTIRRHFKHNVRPSDDPFSQVRHRPATNGCLILEDALAYLECTVQSWMKCGSHWLIYAPVKMGDVLDPTGVTAIEHRKSGSQY